MEKDLGVEEKRKKEDIKKKMTSPYPLLKERGNNLGEETSRPYRFKVGRTLLFDYSEQARMPVPPIQGFQETKSLSFLR